MSFDLTFWKEVGDGGLAGGNVYARLMRGERVFGLANLPVREVLDRLGEAFEDFEPEGRLREIRDGDGMAEVSWGPQYFRFDFRGDWEGIAGKVAAVMRGFGCPVYSAAGDRRYALGDPQWAAGEPDVSGADAGGESGAVVDLPVLPPRRTEEELARADDEFRRRLEALAITDPKSYRNIVRRMKETKELTELAEARDAPRTKVIRAIEAHSPNGRWRRLGHDVYGLANILMNVSLDGPVTGGGAAGENIGTAYGHSSAIHYRLSLVVMGFLEAIPPGHAYADWRKLAAEAGLLAEHYFYGGWREGYREFAYSDPLTTAEARRELPWIDPYREGLLLALLSDDEHSLARIVAWPAEDLPVDDGTLDLTAMDNKYHIWLAGRLRGEVMDGLAGAIRAGKRARAVLLLETAESVFAGDGAGAAERLKKLVGNFRKSGFRTNRMDASVSVEGTILWHVARRRGVEVGGLPAGVMDLIVR